MIYELSVALSGVRAHLYRTRTTDKASTFVLNRNPRRPEMKQMNCGNVLQLLGDLMVSIVILINYLKQANPV